MIDEIKEGDVRESARCGMFKVLEIAGKMVTVKFTNTGNVDTFRKDHIKDGKIKDQKARLTFGVGYTDGEKVREGGPKMLPHYRYWKQILERGYCPKLKAKYPSYLGITVCEEWHSLKNFRVWFEQNYVEGYDLDKDLLPNKNKVYSPETCVFLPRRLNTLLIKRYTNRKDKTLPIGVTKKSNERSRYCARCQVGEQQPHVVGYYDTVDEAFMAYKSFKEGYVKTLADEYNSKGLLCERAYCALSSYEVLKEYH